jgi:hypothetical protein
MNEQAMVAVLLMAAGVPTNFFVQRAQGKRVELLPADVRDALLSKLGPIYRDGVLVVGLAMALFFVLGRGRTAVLGSVGLLIASGVVTMVRETLAQKVLPEGELKRTLARFSRLRLASTAAMFAGGALWLLK